MKAALVRVGCMPLLDCARRTTPAFSKHMYVINFNVEYFFAAFPESQLKG